MSYEICGECKKNSAAHCVTTGFYPLWLCETCYAMWSSPEFAEGDNHDATWERDDFKEDEDD